MKNPKIIGISIRKVMGKFEPFIEIGGEAEDSKYGHVTQVTRTTDSLILTYSDDDGVMDYLKDVTNAIKAAEQERFEEAKKAELGAK